MDFKKNPEAIQELDEIGFRGFHPSMNDKIGNKIKILQDGYIHDTNRILQDYHKEIKEIEGYRGRELLELLQNAVDELTDDKDKSICIKLDENILSVSNNGNVFTESGVTSLMYSDLSPKYNDSKYIGNKGTGFRSILNWADSVCIYSGSLSIKFSRRYAAENLKKLLESKNVARYCEEHPELRMATLVVPEIIEPLDEMEYDTTIHISLKHSQQILDSVKHQLSQIDITLLLFLNKLDRLTINDEGVETEFKKETSNNDDGTIFVRIVKTVDGKVTIQDDWTLLHENGRYKEKRFEVAIAFKPDMSITPDVLYSFFKTDIDFPIPARVHGTFDLSANRNHLAQTDNNKYVLSRICNLIISVSKMLASDIINYAPLRLLSINHDFPKELDWADFTNLFYSEVAKNSILPTINNSYICFVDSPKFYESNIADYLPGEYFESLLQFTDDVVIKRFIRKIASLNKIDLKYEYEDITERINSVLTNMSIRERAFCTAAFLSEYYVGKNDAPLFILDIDGIQVKNKQIVFLQPETLDEGFSQPPEFAKISYLNSEMRKELQDAFAVGTARELASKLSPLNVREYSLTTIIQSVVSKLGHRINPDSKKTKKCCVDTVKWLWKNREAVRALNLSRINFYLIAKDEKLRDISELYWGAEYGNTITDDILPNKPEFFVEKPEVYGINQENLAQFIELFSSLGVSKYPRLVPNGETSLSDGYEETILNNLVYPLKAEDNYYKTKESLIENGVTFNRKVRISYIEHYKHILENAPTKAIIAWLKVDTEALSRVTMLYEDGRSAAYIMERYQQKYREVPAGAMFNYMRFKFFNTKWIEIAGERYAPAECILMNSVSDKLLPEIVAPNLEDYFINPNKKTTEATETKELLQKLGVASEFAELTVSHFYRVLLNLPDKDESGELSRALYTSIVRSHGFKSEYRSNPQYKEFLNSGKVYSKNQRRYVPIGEAYYLTEKTVCADILKRFNLIAIPSRQNTQIIKEFIGVETLRLKGKLYGVPTLHNVDSDFVSDFIDFKTFAFCYRVANAKAAEVSLFKNLKVHVCTRIQADYESGIVDLNAYEYQSGSGGEVFLKAPNSITDINQLKSDIDFCAAVAEIITSTCDIEDNDLFSSLRSLYRYNTVDRRKIVLQDHDNFNILTEAKTALSYTQSQKELFSLACAQMAGSSTIQLIQNNIDRLDFGDINCLDNGSIIIGILNELGVSIDFFNDNSEFSIDLRSNYLNLLNNMATQNHNKYKNYIYNKLVNAAIAEKEQFIKKINSFSNFKYEPDNSVDFQINKYFYEIWPDLMNELGPETDVDRVYITNRSTFIEDKEPEIINDFLTIAINDSLLYFGEYEELEQRYAVHALQFNKQIEEEEELKNPQKLFDKPLADVMTTQPAIKNLGNSKSNSLGNRNLGMVRQRGNADWGAYAERSVYYQFKRQYGDSAQWVSENAKKDNVNPNGIAGLGYDMTYINEKGDLIFVEVKSTKDVTISFVITENELSFAESNAGRYEIIIVTDIEKNPTPQRIKGLFCYSEDESRDNNSRFYLSTEKSYTINCDYFN